MAVALAVLAVSSGLATSYVLRQLGEQGQRVRDCQALVRQGEALDVQWSVPEGLKYDRMRPACMGGTP